MSREQAVYLVTDVSQARFSEDGLWLDEIPVCVFASKRAAEETIALLDAEAEQRVRGSDPQSIFFDVPVKHTVKRLAVISETGSATLPGLVQLVYRAHKHPCDGHGYLPLYPLWSNEILPLAFAGEILAWQYMRANPGSLKIAPSPRYHRGGFPVLDRHARKASWWLVAAKADSPTDISAVEQHDGWDFGQYKTKDSVFEEKSDDGGAVHLGSSARTRDRAEQILQEHAVRRSENLVSPLEFFPGAWPTKRNGLWYARIL